MLGLHRLAGAVAVEVVCAAATGLAWARNPAERGLLRAGLLVIWICAGPYTIVLEWQSEGPPGRSAKPPGRAEQSISPSLELDRKCWHCGSW